MVVHPRPLSLNLGAVDPCGQRAVVVFLWFSVQERQHLCGRRLLTSLEALSIRGIGCGDPDPTVTVYPNLGTQYVFRDFVSWGDALETPRRI